jgi:hypothetical protein
MKRFFTKATFLMIILFSQQSLQAFDFTAAAKKKKKSRKETKHLYGIGWGSILSGGISGDYTYYRIDTTVQDADVSTVGGFDILFLGVQYHYTIKQLDKEKSITVHTFPTLGLNTGFFDEDVFGGLQFPFFINYNYGAGATSSSKEDYGITLGVGVEYIKTGIINLSNNNYFQTSYGKRSSIIQPAFNAGYRYINSRDKIREWNLKIGYLPRKTADKYGNNIRGSLDLPSIWARLSLTYYLGDN